MIRISGKLLLQPMPLPVEKIAKRGLDGIVRALAKEVGEYGITVNQVAPGWTISERGKILFL